MELPSVELLNKVLFGFDYMGEIVTKIYNSEYSKSTSSIIFWYGKKEDDIATINIYELTNKCKEWALTHNYSFETRPYNDYGHIDWHIAIWKDNIQLLPINLCVSEPEAIFNACQWLLDSKKIEKED
jgi:hypothetical protein